MKEPCSSSSRILHRCQWETALSVLQQCASVIRALSQPGVTCKVVCCDLLCDPQVIDPHTHEYMDRLRDGGPVFLALAQKVHDYFARISDTRNQSKVALRLIEHFYFKTGGWQAGLAANSLHAG